MHIVFGIERNVDVEHGRHIFDVQATGRHIGADQQIHIAPLKGVQRLQTLVLALVAVQRRCAKAIALQRTGQTGTPQFAVDEHKSLGHATLFDQVTQSGALVVLFNPIKTLLNRRRRGVGSRHFNGDRVLQIAAGQTLDFGRERGREQQGGAALGQMAKDALQIGQKADVQHAIGLVKHHILHLVKHAVFGFNVIQQPPRGGHQHLNTLFQLGCLGLHVHATKHHRAAQLGVLGVHLDLLCHLVSQLAGGQQNQGAHRVPRRRSRGVLVFEQTLQQRQGKRGGFAGACLRGSHDIAALQYHRNGLRLNGRHALVAHFGHGTRQRWREG